MRTNEIRAVGARPGGGDFPAWARELDRQVSLAGDDRSAQDDLRPYRAGFGPVKVSPYAVTEVVAVSVVPSADREVSVAVQRPAAYVCSTLCPSAAVPSPKSQ